jgi:hypothetical protein
MPPAKESHHEQIERLLQSHQHFVGFGAHFVVDFL